jgi:DNA-binding MarR family transcriptional regulator
MTKDLPPIRGTVDDTAWQPLGQRLLIASDWFEHRLQAELQAKRFPSVNHSQLRTLTLLALQPDSPSALARKVGITKQSMQTLLNVLHEAGLVGTVPNHRDRRAIVVELTPRGTSMMRAAKLICRRLEETAAATIGVHALGAIDHALRHPMWQEPGEQSF